MSEPHETSVSHEPSNPRRMRPEDRRAQLVACALQVFREKGVADTLVSDIVRAAGVAQGTFYLYFKTKDDVTDAVFEMMADELVDRVERALGAPGGSAVDRLLVLRDALVEITDEPHEQELLVQYHRPENRAEHDLLGQTLWPRLAPLLAAIVRQGVEEGVFTAEDPETAAWFILGGVQALEIGFDSPGALDKAIASVTTFVLRGLAYSGPLPGSLPG